jgi:hypothetical protein
MTAKTVALSNGFIKYPDAPALMQRSRIFGSSPPVMMIAGGVMPFAAHSAQHIDAVRPSCHPPFPADALFGCENNCFYARSGSQVKRDPPCSVVRLTICPQESIVNLVARDFRGFGKRRVSETGF